MAYLEIRQTGPLSGTYRVQGSKNAVLPMLAATLLVPGKTTLHRVPKIKDVNVMLEILHLLGCSSCWEGAQLIFTCMSFRRLASSFIMNGRNTSLHRPIIFAVLIFS